MKINEITAATRALIKEMESLYITYCTHSTDENKQRLWQLVEYYQNSEDVDLRKQSEIYRHKMHDILLKILSK